MKSSFVLKKKVMEIKSRAIMFPKFSLKNKINNQEKKGYLTFLK